MLHMTDDGAKVNLKAWYAGLTDKQKAAIKSVSMDVWATFISVTLEHKALMDEGRDDIKGSKYS
ncbi:MAG: hypothetical protein ABW168_01520 [Sedimenticola sp.]